MPPPPAFSIIVPLHNESEDIGPTCEALLRLEPEPEMVFVDDGSTDDDIRITPITPKGGSHKHDGDCEHEDD